MGKFLFGRKAELDRGDPAERNVPDRWKEAPGGWVGNTALLQ